MPVRIYDHNESVCCQKVRVACLEKGLEYENVHVEFSRREQFTPEFLKLNPKAVVPVLVHDGLVVTESTAINEYINEAFEGPSLMPATPYGRARKRYWSQQVDYIHQPHTPAVSFAIAFRKVILGRIDSPEKIEAYFEKIRDPVSRDVQRETFALGLDSPKFQQSIGEFDRLLADMDATLEHSPWLAGDEFSLADIDVAPYIWRLHTLQLDQMWSERKNVTDWCSRLWSRASWQQGIVGRHLDDWLQLMETEGKKAWPKVEQILSASRELSSP